MSYSSNSTFYVVTVRLPFPETFLFFCPLAVHICEVQKFTLKKLTFKVYTV